MPQVVTSFNDTVRALAARSAGVPKYNFLQWQLRKGWICACRAPSMSKQAEIWYFEQSLAAPLLLPLRGRYTLHAMSRDRDGRKTALPPDGGIPIVFFGDVGRAGFREMRKLAERRPAARLIGVSSNGHGAKPIKGCFATLPSKAPSTQICKTIDAALANIELAQQAIAARQELQRTEREMDELNRIGVALSETRDGAALLQMILSKAREITHADAGSLYLIEEIQAEGASSERQLRFKLTQNDSLQIPFAERVLPLREDSLAGYSALRGEVINLADAHRIPRGRPYRFNSSFDHETGYRTRSLVTLPMKNGRGEVIGVLQLINCKPSSSAKLTTPAIVAREVHPFSSRAVRLASSLASQAAVAYENSRLYQDIEKLFEGFVRAAVTAIEQRDPTTSGHSQRVSRMTVGLAQVVDRSGSGNYGTIRFTSEQMKEIRYAALLHDFGKVGVREEVLVKAKKLYPAQMENLAHRFDYLYKDLEASLEREKVRILLRMDRDAALVHIAKIEDQYRLRRMELEDGFHAIVQANEPTVMPEGRFDRIFEIARQTYRDPRGAERPILTPDEVHFLSIPKGSLNSDERAQIESHVVHSFNFLMQIPWTREFRGIPRIARAHHEKLNGTGYPYRLRADEIPVQAKIMTICDMFDALSASDRPYKKAVPAERALDILQMSVNDHELDPELFELFVDAKVFHLANRPE